jgi:hypothetical protein
MDKKYPTTCSLFKVTTSEENKNTFESVKRRKDSHKKVNSD